MSTSDVRIQSTTINEGLGGFVVEIEMRDPANEGSLPDFVHFRVMVHKGDQSPLLADVQLKALSHARDVIIAEIARLESPVSDIPQQS